MHFFETVLSEKTKNLREKVLNHPFWKKIEDGSLDKKYLKTFILQDFWLVKQALTIDSLIIASMKTPIIRELLLQRLPKSVNFQTLFDFGKGLGLSEKDFLYAMPLPGCMALTTFFFWMIDNSTDEEKIASIDASKEVFSTACVNVKQALKNHYGLNDKQVEFFAKHKGVEKKLSPVDNYLENLCKNKVVRENIDRAIWLSYGHELLFYDTIIGNYSRE